MNFRHTTVPVIAAAKAGFSAATAYRIETDPRFRRRRRSRAAVAGRSACRCLGQRDRAAAGGAPGLRQRPFSTRFAGAIPGSPRHAPDLGAPHRHLADAERRRRDVIFRQEHPPGPWVFPILPTWAVAASPSRASRSIIGSITSDWPSRARTRPCRARRRELRGARGRCRTRCGAGRGPDTSQRQPVDGVPQPRS